MAFYPPIRVQSAIRWGPYLPDPSRVVDQQVGAILGLVGALMITLGGLESMRAQAARARARQLRTRPRRTGGSPGELARVHA